MNRDICFSGTVVHGKKFGRVLGFPTANIDRKEYSRKKIKIRFGIWSGIVQISNSRLQIQNFKAAIIIGPLDGRGLPKLEAHILGFSGNLYGKKITFCLKNFIRPYKAFKTIKELQEQIKKDISTIK